MEPNEDGTLDDFTYPPEEQIPFRPSASNTESTNSIENLETKGTLGTLINKFHTTEIPNKHPQKVSNLNVTRAQSLKLDQFEGDKNEYNFPYGKGISCVSSATQGNHVTTCNLPKMKRNYSSLSDIRSSFDVHNNSNTTKINSKLEKEDCPYSGHDTKECDDECSCQMCSCCSCCEDCRCDVLNSNMDISDMSMQDKTINSERLPLNDNINSNARKYRTIFKNYFTNQIILNSHEWFKEEFSIIVYILVVLLKLQRGTTAGKVSTNTSLKINHWFVDKINVITDTSDNEEEPDGDQSISNTIRITRSNGMFL